MTEAVYAVRLHGAHVGAIIRRNDFTKFVFDQDYWNRPDRRVLGRWFEEHPRRQPHATNAVPAWFSNLLPEGRLRALIAREQGVSTGKEMDLLERIGRDLPGAVEVLPDGVEAQRRDNVLFLLNHSDAAREIGGVVGTDLLSGAECTGHVVLAPRSTMVVVR